MDRFSQSLSTLQPIVDVVAGLGLAAVFAAVMLAILRRNSQLRQWRRFKVDLEKWATTLLARHQRHPNELSDEDWRAECETMLYDARFTPTEITQIMDLAIIVAKATTLDLLDLRER